MLLAGILLVLGVVAGLIRGGSLNNVSSVEFRMPWLVFVGLALQVGADALAPSLPALNHGAVGPALLALSYALVVAFVALNFRYPGTVLIGIGLVLNLAVILTNGAMPVSLAAVRVAAGHALPGLQEGVKHKAMGPATRLRFLGDIIPMPGLGIASVGDAVLGAGVFVLVQRLVGYQPKRQAAAGLGRRRVPPTQPRGAAAAGERPAPPAGDINDPPAGAS